MMHELLAQKYGSPESEFVVAINENSVPEAEWPSYLASGAIRFETMWVKEKIDILLTLSDIDKQPSIQIKLIIFQENIVIWIP